MIGNYLKNILIFVFLLTLVGCDANRWNSPYEVEKAQQPILFSSFSAKPKHLDPVVSYNANEWAILSQVVEPPLQYHYLKRPYTLEPLTLSEMPELRYLDTQGQLVADANADIVPDSVAYTEYVFRLTPNILFQPHPAFVKNEKGELALSHLTESQLASIETMADFQLQATRPLNAHDYVYAIKRMALTQNHSPILGTMQPLIVGLKSFSEQMSSQTPSVDELRSAKISGVSVDSETQWRIKIKGVYPQFLYWLSMNFFAPIPWEAEVFFNQAGLKAKNISLDSYPVGTGAYQLVENNPNKQMRLVANPNYQHGFYPSEGLAEGADPVLLADAGKPLPFIQEVIYSLEKESVPLWNKFLQGYYDASGVSSDSFDQAISVSSGGSLTLTDEMQQKGIQFLNTIEPTIFYFGFNMADPVVGGYSEKQKKLRQAISIALNFEEYISIFMNGRGMAAQGPIPPGIFGHEVDRFNRWIYDWHQGRAQRKSMTEAKALLAEAGYPNGRKPNGDPLVLHYDTAATGPDSKAQLNWYRKQFQKLGIELVIRATDYNRFQDKMRGAKAQLFSWGWNADYPDPENFLFLLDGEQTILKTDGAGINYANYDNPEFNQLFKQIKTLPNSPQRLALVRQMIEIVQQDAPWAWGFYPKSLALYHRWYHNVWANPLANNTLKYKRIDPELRNQLQQQWNPPTLWPMLLMFVIAIGLIWPLSVAYRKRQQATIVSKEIS